MQKDIHEDIQRDHVICAAKSGLPRSIFIMVALRETKRGGFL
jgi:hypothetical protein